MRFLAIVCLISILLSVTIISKIQAKAYSNACISPNSSPIVTETPVVPTSAQPSVVFNEILSSPQTGWNCAYQNTPNGRQNAWIELYNLQDQPLNLYAGLTCVDAGPNTIQVCLNVGSTIPAHGFLTFFPYMISNRFTLKSISTLRLLLAYVPVDQVNIPTLPYDVSYARIPDGTGKWQQALVPTINSSNSITISPSPTPTHLYKKQKGKSKATTTGKKKSPKSTNDTTVASIGADDSQQIQDDIGKQTQWHGLQFPSSLASPSALSTTSEDTRSTPSSPSAPAENVPQKMLFSLIGIAALLSVWLGWRRFFKKKQ